MTDFEDTLVWRNKSMLIKSLDENEPGDLKFSDELKGSCQVCIFWRRLASEDHKDFGYCRRNPPQMVPTESSRTSFYKAGHFPTTEEDDTCGEFEMHPAVIPTLKALLKEDPKKYGHLEEDIAGIEEWINDVQT